MVNNIREINTNADEGKLLIAALTIISTECRTTKTLDMILVELNSLVKKIYEFDDLDIIV